MPLNRPALSLGSGPRGVQDARQWVAATFADINRNDLTECAELGVSALTTNALLHAIAPIQVAVRGTREHPRVEVRDRSADRPVLPEPIGHDDHHAELLTFGRGLNIVARASDAWGAEIEDDGKVVWFTPGSTFSDSGAEGLITGVTVDDPGPVDDGDRAALEIRNVPVSAYASFQRHYREAASRGAAPGAGTRARVSAGESCPTCSGHSRSRCGRTWARTRCWRRRPPVRATSNSTACCAAPTPSASSG